MKRGKKKKNKHKDEEKREDYNNERKWKRRRLKKGRAKMRNGLVILINEDNRMTWLQIRSEMRN